MKLALKLQILLFSIASLLFSCKKDVNQNMSPIDLNKPDPLTLLQDSVSFTLNGKAYVFRRLAQGGYGSIPTNDKDSVIFKSAFYFVSVKGDEKVHFFFNKKYAKAKMSKKGDFYVPVNYMDQYPKGDQKYALDFNRGNSMSGMAIEFDDRGYGPSDEGDASFFSYIKAPINKPTSIGSDSQRLSKFEITEIKQLKDGSHLIEAKFNAVLFDQDEKPVKLENGYMRLGV